VSAEIAVRHAERNANASVIRLENSPKLSRCLEGRIVAGLEGGDVGIDSSSLTPDHRSQRGGKKRLPTISWRRF